MFHKAQLLIEAGGTKIWSSLSGAGNSKMTTCNMADRKTMFLAQKIADQRMSDTNKLVFLGCFNSTLLVVLVQSKPDQRLTS